MFIEAIYKETWQKCYINMDCVIDVFCEDGEYIAYTFDNDRGGYIITPENLFKCFEDWNVIKTTKG